MLNQRNIVHFVESNNIVLFRHTRQKPISVAVHISSHCDDCANFGWLAFPFVEMYIGYVSLDMGSVLFGYIFRLVTKVERWIELYQ